jgi:hypothetical protein
MKLTGKCLEDFEIWFRKEKATPTLRYWMIKVIEDETIENSLIIDFFDSIYIYIIIDRKKYSNKWFHNIDGYGVKEFFSSRKNAKNAAIKKLNEEYNQICNETKL